MSTLFSPLQVGNIEIKNRIVMPPMCMYQADVSGCATDFHLTHYLSRAIGGVGLIILEATAIEPCGRISDQDLGLWNDNQVPGLQKIAGQIKNYGAIAGIQINHAGRKCGALSEEIIYGPSDIPFSEDFPQPKAMTLEDIRHCVQLFSEAAARAEQAGFEYLEIHAAHGYLLSSFLSPLSNQRQDDYGGSHENRVRFLAQVILAVKKVFHGVLGVRISAEDYAPGGNQPLDLVKMINLVKSHGVDLVHVSSGGVVSVVPPFFPGYQIPLAEKLKTGCKLPVIGGGLLTQSHMLEEIIANKRADMVFVGRELLRNPHFPLQAAHELGANILWPKSYERAKFL